ncbi:hypothetical protein OUZ56_008075 [Daphnia magna]|uniref:Brain chitinase and chia n=1 Tax=Daphnia magna TaxID=35525 RepID=A0ABR0ABV8_9CRUS|nr:hypothetical protein OUZ56_008075 [Daphnia magna]
MMVELIGTFFKISYVSYTTCKWICVFYYACCLLFLNHLAFNLLLRNIVSSVQQVQFAYKTRMNFMSSGRSAAMLLLLAVLFAPVLSVYFTGGYYYDTRCNFYGYDMGKKLNFALREGCGTLCLNTPGCTHFSHNSLYCYLKRNPGFFHRNYNLFTNCGWIPNRSAQTMSDYAEFRGVVEDQVYDK